MLDKKNKQAIANNIAEDIKKNYKKIDNFDLYMINKIKEEKKNITLNSKNIQKVVVYDEKFNPLDSDNINIIFEDFIGKSERLNVFNSCESAILDEKSNESIHYLFKMFCKKMLFNINCFVGNLFNFSRKNIGFFFSLFLNHLFLIFYNFIITLLFFVLDITNCFTFKIYKILLNIKYKIFKKNSINILGILLNFPLFILKQILIFLKEIGNLLAGIFGILNNSISFIAKKIKSGLYSKITANKVNRDKRTAEHSNILYRINEKAKEIFKRHNLENKRFLENFEFSKANSREFSSKKIKDEALKEYVKTLEELEIQQIINQVKKTIGSKIQETIYKKEISLKLKLLRKKNKEMMNYEKKVNKHLKKKFKDNNIMSDIFNENIEKGL